MSYKILLSLLATVLTLTAFFPYIRSIIQNEVKPHVFSWIIWGVTTFIAFLAQYKDNGGAGSIVIGISATITLFIAFLAFLKRTDVSIKKVDWVFLILALVSLPFWYFTSNPLWAVIILTIVEVLGFGPTIRKAYHYPFEENITFYVVMGFRNILAIIAMENYSLTTISFPAVIALFCVSLVILIGYRRRKLKEP